MPEISFLAWRLKGSRNFTTTWHLCRDAKWTLCGREPEGIISSRITTPAVEEQCNTCRERYVRESEIR